LAPDADVRRWLLSYAILAPHAHNLQSWLADLRTPGEISLYCDPARLLPQTDPFSRQIMLSHGSFLELLDLAARERGLRAEIVLFPEGAFATDRVDARPVARVRLVPDTAIAKDPLFAQILVRHTNRGLYDAQRAVPAASWQALQQSVADTPFRVGFAGLDAPQVLAQQRRIALDAWRIELSTARTMQESLDVMRVGAAEISQHRDGISLLDPMPVLMARLGLFDRSQAPAADSSVTQGQIKDFAAKLESTSGFMWLVTPTNDRATQVQAGRAYVRLQLAATAQGLSMQPISQALQEYPEQKENYVGIHALTGAIAPNNTVQMWLRVGYAPTVEPAPRRALQDFIRA
jgi:nitroreductase